MGVFKASPPRLKKNNLRPDIQDETTLNRPQMYAKLGITPSEIFPPEPDLAAQALRLAREQSQR